MRKLIPVADDDLCLTAVKAYVEEIRDAGHRATAIIRSIPPGLRKNK